MYQRFVSLIKTFRQTSANIIINFWLNANHLYLLSNCFLKVFKKKFFKKNQCKKISKAGSINCDEKSKKQTMSLKKFKIKDI